MEINNYISMGRCLKPCPRTAMGGLLRPAALVSAIDMQVVYRIIYPNGEIYVVKDRTNSINYFASTSDEWIARDFTHEQRQNFSVTRDILWASEKATCAEVTRVEVETIRRYRSNDPAVGYNQWPPYTAW